MSGIEWAFVIVWPVVVVVINNLLAAHQMKHMAQVTCENFNKTGQALEIVLASIREIERALEKQGVEIPSPIDSRRANDVGRIAH